MGIEALAKLQDILYHRTPGRYCSSFKAMDAAGKDGAIKHVMSGINPQGCQVASFKHPQSRNWTTTTSGAVRSICRTGAH